MNLTSPIIATGQTLFADSSTAQCKPGVKAWARDGREFRYVLNGAANLIAGNCIQSPAQITAHQQLTPVAAAIGDTKITLALGATAAVLNQYAGGLAIVDTTPGEGYGYGISGNLAILASGTGDMNLNKDDGIQVALTTASRVTLQMNPHVGVIQTPVTTLTGTVVGVAIYPVTAAFYAWVQVRGACGVLINGTPAVGQLVGCPGTVAGAADINAGTETAIGSMLVTGVDTKILPVLLNLP